MRTKKCVACGKVFATNRTEQTKCDDCLSAARSTTLRTRTCRTCGTTFLGGPRARYCPVCRAERRKAQEKKYQTVGFSRHLGDIDNCVICGGEYVIRSGLQKYCPDCAPGAIREIDCAQANRWNAEHDYCARRREKPRSGIKICAVCGKEMTPGTPTVTCSQACAAAHRKAAQRRADEKRRHGQKNDRKEHAPMKKIKQEIIDPIEDKTEASPNASVTLPDKLFYELFGSAIETAARDAYVSDWALSSAWGDDPETEIPAARIEALGQLWDAAHLTIRDIRAHTGLSQAAFAVRYCIPRRTVENWESGDRQCPDYLRLLLAQAVGLYTRPTVV